MLLPIFAEKTVPFFIKNAAMQPGLSNRINKMIIWEKEEAIIPNDFLVTAQLHGIISIDSHGHLEARKPAERRLGSALVPFGNDPGPSNLR